jgi:amino acid transporter
MSNHQQTIPIPPVAHLDPHASQLRGQMGPVELAMTVLAFAAPLASVVGVLPLVIMFGGVGAPMAFAAATVVLLLFSVGYTAMSRYLPNPGAFYAYISAGIGKPVGLAASFMAILGYLMIGLGIAIFFGIVASDLANTLFGSSLMNWYGWTLALVAAVGLLGYLRIDLSAKVLTLVMALEILIVLIFDLVVVANGGPEGLSTEPFKWGSLSEGAVGVSILFAVLTFLGFEATAIFREETRNPNKSIPQATYLAVTFIGVFYVITTWLLIIANGPTKAVEIASANPTGMFVDGMVTFVGGWAANVLSVLVVTSAFAAVLSCQNIVARYCFSLGSDRVLPSILGRVHPRHGSPYVASLLLTAVFAAGTLAFSGTDPNSSYAWLAGAGGFPLLVLMFLTSVSVILFFRKYDGADAHINAWQSLIAPMLATAGLGMAVYMSASNFVDLTGGSASIATTLQVIIWAVFFVGLGLSLFYRSSRPDVYARIGRQPIA